MGGLAISHLPAQASDLPFRLRGHLLLAVQSQGQVWYVDMENGLRYSLVQPRQFHALLREKGQGVFDADLRRIPVAVDSRLVVIDSDNDGLDDRLERALGTDPFLADTDGDGYPDGLEVRNHFDPLGPDRLPIDWDFARRLSGRILLQVEGNGEAWYVHPRNQYRYFLSGHEALLRLTGYLGIGISNFDLDTVIDSRAVAEQARKSIKIDSGHEQRLYYYLGDTAIGSFPVSSGKVRTPTPRGEYLISNKHPRAWSPFGLWMPFWLGLDRNRIGLHELPVWPSGYREGQDHLGTPVSHGCVRLGPGPAEFVYYWAEIGTPVTIY